MIPYLGDFAEDATVYIAFNTFDSNDPSASATITNLADADIYVHKDGSIANLVTDGASVVIDFDGITGSHVITIDTSAHADYSVGSDYMVRIEGATVDAGTINAVVGHFSIENRYNAAAVDLANATDGLGAIKAILDTSGVVLQADQAVNATKISGSATAADNLEASALGIITGVAAAGTLTTTTMTSTLTGTYADDELIGRLIVWTSGTAAGQAATITDYANTGETFTYAPITTAPIAGDVFVIV